MTRLQRLVRSIAPSLRSSVIHSFNGRDAGGLRFLDAVQRRRTRWYITLREQLPWFRTASPGGRRPAQEREEELDMPFYDFTCIQCSSEFTLRRKIEEMDDPAPCPKCGSEETKRQIGIFYATNTGSSTAAASSPKTTVRHI
jgi:putative FmdB family regulatory protein